MAIGSAAASLGIASGIYGIWSIKSFLGVKEANRILSPPFPISYYLELPLIAPILVLSRTHVIDSILPILPFTLLHFSPATFTKWAGANLSLRNGPGGVPSPTSTMVVLPWVRMVYLALRRRIFNSVINHKFLPPTEAAGAVRLVRQRHFHGDHQPGQQQEEEEEIGAAEALNIAAGREDGIPNGAHDHLGAAVTLSVNVLSRICVGALLMPVIVSASGNLLLRLAKLTGSMRLRQFLGLGSNEVWNIALGQKDAASTGSSWLPWVGLGGSFSGKSTEAVDPVWWRNAVGGSIFVVLKDAVILLHRIAEIKRTQSRRIREVPISRSLNLEFVDRDNWRTGNA